MKKSHSSPLPIPPRHPRHNLLVAGLLGSLFTASSLSADTTLKADNSDNLEQPSSWVDGIVPDDETTAVWDSTVSGSHSSFSLGQAVDWRGISILNPGASVNISGSALNLGRGGIDLSDATQDLAIGNNVHFAVPQKIVVGADRTLSFTGTPSKAHPTGLEFELAAGAQVQGNWWGAWFAPEMIRLNDQFYGVINGTDFAAEDADLRIRPGSDAQWPVYEGESATPYTPNPAGPTPTVGAHTLMMDFVDDSGYGARLGNTYAVQNMRFNMPNENHPEWFFDTSVSGRVLTTASVLVTENVGAQDVRIGGPGWFRISGTTDGGMLIFQNNTQGDFIVSNVNGLSQQGIGRSLTKLGPGRAIIDTVTHYTGPTYIAEGTLRFTGNVHTHSAFEVAGGTLDLSGADLRVTEVNVEEGGRVSGRGTIGGFTTTVDDQPVDIVTQIVNHGAFDVDTNGTTLRLEGDVVNYGDMTVSQGSHLEITGTFTNYGTLDYSGGYATLPEGWVNEGTVIEGNEGPPPSPIHDLRITGILRDGQDVAVSVPSAVGYEYLLERSYTLISPSAEHTQVTTASGQGADTHVSNDGHQSPDANNGGAGAMYIRNFEEVRQKMGIIRFDISGLTSEHMLDEAELSLFLVGGVTRTRTFELWGATDEAVDGWFENEVTYNTFDGFLEAPLGTKSIDEGKMTHLGDFQVEQATGRVYSTDPSAVPLGDFLRSSTNNVVTFVFFMTGTDTSADYTFATKENPDLGSAHPVTGVEVIAPTLTVPTPTSFQEHQLYDPWVQVGPVVTGSGEELIFADTIPEDRDRAFYRVIAREE